MPKAKSSTTAQTEIDPSAPALIPAERWAPVKAKWHDKGSISEGQVKRLIAIGLQSGWSAAEIRREVKLGLDVELDAIPYKDPYELTVALFSTARPQA